MSKKIMKRSLALGALMAFVITGSAMSVAEAATYQPANGKPLTVEKTNATYPDKEDYYVTGDGERVVGGWTSMKDIKDTVLNSNITVKGGEFNAVIGGNRISGVVTDMTVNSTNVTIDGATVKQLIGGTEIQNVNDEDIAAGRTTNITINSGYLGTDNDNTNCPEKHVVAGDMLKVSPYDAPEWRIIDASSTIEKTNLNINGGTFDAAIYGGSAAVRCYAGFDSVNSEGLEATVNTANINITGGTFNEVISAGGLAFKLGTKSIVNEAYININGDSGNLSFGENADIFAGGFLDDEGYNTNAKNATVGKAVIKIVNATVSDIYGYGGKLKGVSQNKPHSAAYTQHKWFYVPNTDADAAVNTTLKLTNVTAGNVDIPLGSVTLRVEDDENTKGEINIGQSKDKTGLTVTEDGDNKVTVSVEANGAVNDAYAGDYKKMVEERFKVKGYDLIKDDAINDEAIEDFTVEEGEVMGAATLGEDGKVIVQENQGNTGIKDIVATGLISWRYEMNDMNKRMGELRNANGEHGVWVRMVRGETEYNSVKNQYNQYQLGYDEKLSVDPSWTVGVALSYTEADNNFSKGTGESTNKALSIYGSKLNDDGTFIDLIAKYARLENDFDLGTAKGDYDTNGYSFSAEYGKRIQQGNGLWIEPQVELTYGQVDGATYMVGGRTVNQDNMESLIGRVGFSLGKDISKGNVYARASYLYDFEGETSATFSKESATDSFEQDLGGGWWEVGVGANINLSKATYIYADIEKTFGGEVDTNWQWNLGVRYSF